MLLALLFHEAMKPKLVDAPGASAPFQLTFRAVTAAPFWVSELLQDWVTCCPSAKVNVADHPDDATLVAFITVT